MWSWAIFMLEGLAALAIAFILMKKKFATRGDRAKLFLILYCSSQILLESLRRDQFLRWLFVRVSQLTAVLVLGGMMFWALYRWMKAPVDRRMPKKQLIINWVVFLLGVGICIAMEFAVDKAAFMPVWLCYTIMGVCCVIFGYTAHQLILKGTKE
jgi:prolipoprotein diacylglyceryltransferase